MQRRLYEDLPINSVVATEKKGVNLPIVICCFLGMRCISRRTYPRFLLFLLFLSANWSALPAASKHQVCKYCSHKTFFFSPLSAHTKPLHRLLK
jgi:hypothetical protein